MTYPAPAPGLRGRAPPDTSAEAHGQGTPKRCLLAGSGHDGGENWHKRCQKGRGKALGASSLCVRGSDAGPEQQEPEEGCSCPRAVLTGAGTTRTRTGNGEEGARAAVQEDFLALLLRLPRLHATCQSLMPRRRAPLLNAHYDKMRSAGKSPLLINTFPAYLEIFWSQRQFAFWETASLYRLSNNSFVQHLPVV